MIDPTTSQVIKEALEKYGLDKVTPTELATRIKNDRGLTIPVSEIVAMKARIRQGVEKLQPREPEGQESGEQS